jgi:hypothetical protein
MEHKQNMRKASVKPNRSATTLDARALSRRFRNFAALNRAAPLPERRPTPT